MRLFIGTTILLSLFSLVNAVDTWTTAGRDAEFPSELYFVGVGASDKSQDAAKQMSVVEVRKQISVRITASQLDEQSSTIAGGREISSSRVESRARLTTSGEVQGVQVVKTVQQGKVWYALAVLDKKNFAANTRAEMSDLNKQLEALVKNAQADIAGAKVSAALGKLSESRRLIIRFAELRTLLSAAVALGEVDQCRFTMTDINGLYEKCVSSLKAVKSSGDNQSMTVGMAPAEPFSILITADNMPVTNLPVSLMQGSKRLADKFTDDNGTVQFYAGNEVDLSGGTHLCQIVISLPVSSTSKKYLTAQAQDFSYVVVSNPCPANIVVETSQNIGTDLNAVTAKVIARLGKLDIRHDPASKVTVKVSLTANEAGGVAGLSENNSFIKSDLTASFIVLDDGDKQMTAFQGSAKGMGGSLAKSVMNGIDNLKVEKDLKGALEKICGFTSAPKKKIALFDFRNRGPYAGWWEIAEALSDMMITGLINTGRYDVVERSQLDKILQEKALAQSGVVEEKDALAAAQLAGADLVLVGSVSTTAGHIEADARVIDVKTGVAGCAMNSASYEVSNLRALADDLMRQVKGKCGK